MAATTTDLSATLPRVLIVSRRTILKNKFVDFVGEYHLDLIVSYGAVPVIVPRVSGVDMLLDSYEPIHGVLLCEGEDLDPSLYENELTSLSSEELEEIRSLHHTAIDKEKDKIEFRLTELCLERNIPILGICRGLQLLNVICGGTLYLDIGKELSNKVSNDQKVMHMDYNNYDGHRHVVQVVENTPLHEWFSDSLEKDDTRNGLMVNSYHHQGVKILAQRFVPMAFAPDGIIEAFYDPDAYNPDEGKFIMGLQFHPERLRKPDSGEFEYPGCPYAYKEFVKAVIAYKKKLNTTISKPIMLDQHMEKKKKVTVPSFSPAKTIYGGHDLKSQLEESDLAAGAEFLESSKFLSLQMEATVKNESSYIHELKLNEERENLARNIMEKMSIEELSDLTSFHQKIGQISAEVLERKLYDGLVNELSS